MDRRISLGASNFKSPGRRGGTSKGDWQRAKRMGGKPGERGVWQMMTLDQGGGCGNCVKSS